MGTNVLYFPPAPDKRAIFHTIITSERHKKYGDCKDGDFGTIQLILLERAEKQLIVSFDDYDNRVEFIEYGGCAFLRMDKEIPHLSRDEADKQNSVQGKYTVKKAVEFCLRMRERMERTFFGVGSMKLLLVGNTLYSHYCDISKLSVTVNGNLVFSYWLSIDIKFSTGNTEALSKPMFEKIVRAERKRFEDGKPKGQRGDGHVSFSCPTNVKWGEKYRKAK